LPLPNPAGVLSRGSREQDLTGPFDGLRILEAIHTHVEMATSQPLQNMMAALAVLGVRL
jgi:hypothetical protein